jgi:hypothetical protein
MRFWQQLLQLMELTACGSLADHELAGVQQLVLHLKQKRARNKQANNQAKEAHPKKLCTKYSHSYRKICESGMQK